MEEQRIYEEKVNESKQSISLVNDLLQNINNHNNMNNNNNNNCYNYVFF